MIFTKIFEDFEKFPIYASRAGFGDDYYYCFGLFGFDLFGDFGTFDLYDDFARVGL